MININNIFNISNSNKKEFKPYYEKENDFKRLALLYGIAGLVISPIFCFFIYKSSIPYIYFQIGVSFTVLFPTYITLCYFVKPLYNKLIYFFVIHFFIVTFIAFQSNLQSNFELIHTFCFYALFTVILFVIQRLYPAILYNFFVLFLLIYAYNRVHNAEIPVIGTIGMFSVISLISILVLVSRKRLITSVEDYSDYLSTIVNNPGIGYVLLKFSSNKEQVIDFNTESYRLLNCKKENLPSLLFEHFSPEEQQQMFNLKIGNEFEKTITLSVVGKTRFLELDVTILPLKSGMYWLLRIVDVTTKISEKEALEIREKKYRNLYYRNQAGVFTTDMNSMILDCNLAFEEMFEGELTKGKKLFHNRSEKEWKEILELIEFKDSLRNYQTHFVLKNGRTKWFIFNWYIDKATNQIEGTIIDLTEVQQTATALSQSEEKYRLIYEESNDAILLIEEDKIIDVNRKGIQLFGIPEHELLTMNLADLSFESSAENRKNYFKNKQKLHLSKSAKFNWVFKGNNQRIEAEVAFIELMFGDKSYYQCVIHDQTERINAMRSLERNRESFKSIIENTPEGILIIHEDQLLYTNKGIHAILDADEVHLDRLFVGNDQNQFEELLAEQRLTKTIYQQQFKLKTASKSDILVDVTIVSTLFEDKESILVIIKDISLQHKLSREMLRAEIAEETNKKLATEIKERIRTEKLLQEQFLRSNAIFDSSSNTLLLTLDTDFKISSFNTHCQNYFWYLIEERMLVNDSFTGFFSQVYDRTQIRYFLLILNAVKKGESKQMETYFTSKGSLRWIELFINPIFDIEGQVTEISLVAHDITEKKLSEKEIVESLKEKEVLLKEIHHRVKNNLQVISSILNLQSSFVKDEKTLEILDESRNRIRSMAIIHENLYRTTNFSSINFSSYLQNLCINLISSYHVYSGVVEFKDEMEHVDLVLDQAIPCGLLVNELITNSIKYAFPTKQAGEITVGLEEKEEKIYLRIEDNGIGLPKDFDMMKTDTLGLQLVSTLVEQLDGEITVRNHQGTKYLITFGKVKL
ncbi:MAG: hypothetical protein RLZ33_201 [Bacteroidota bacterium]|jgi:PAS domain S-box-containing protein